VEVMAGEEKGNDPELDRGGQPFAPVGRRVPLWKRIVGETSQPSPFRHKICSQNGSPFGMDRPIR